MAAFVDWVSGTGLSTFFQLNIWAISVLQTIHILAFAAVIASVLMLNLRILGVTGRALTMTDTARRYVPWVWAALIVLAMTGLFLIIAEPRRSLLNLTFQVKMVLLLIGIVVTAWFQTSLRRRVAFWEANPADRSATRIFAVLTFLLWCAIAVAGRWIAYTPYPEF